MKTDYEKQAQDFLTETGTEFKAEFDHFGKYFEGDTHKRDIYSITLKRGALEYTFSFGQSLVNSGKWQFVVNGVIKGVTRASKGLRDPLWKKHTPKVPTPYDVLASITSCNPGTFEDFCSEYGYSSGSRSVERTYNAVLQEFIHMDQMFTTEELEKLQEIA